MFMDFMADWGLLVTPLVFAIVVIFFAWCVGSFDEL